MAKLAELVEEQNKIWNYMSELRDVAEGKNGKEQREWTDEERGTWDTNEVRLQVVSGDIARLQEMARMEGIKHANFDPDTGEGGDSRGAVDDDDDDSKPSPEQIQRDKTYRKAFNGYMRGGLDRLKPEQRELMLSRHEELRAEGVATGSAGGFLVPQGFRAVLSETLKAYGGLINHANVITTSTGNALPWPTNDDTGNIGSILTENTQISQLDVAFSTRTLNAYVYTSNLVLVSLQLLQDSAFDINTWLPKKLGQRIGRATAAHLTAGTGTAQPLGVTTNCVVGKTGLTGQTLTLIYDDLIDLEHSVDPAYRSSPNCRYVMNDGVLKVIRKLKDAQNRPLWVPIPAPGFPATINGFPYTIDNNMPVPAANAKSIVFGDFQLGYIVRQVVDVQMVRMQERYMDYLQVGFFGFSRLDARPDDPGALRAYQHSAT